MTSSSSESRRGSNKPRSATTPPTSMAPISSPPKCSSPIAPRTKTATDGPALQIHEFSTTAPRKTLGNSGRRKRAIPYSLFQGGVRDEDSIPPTKKFKTLQTTWNQTSAPSPEVAILVDERMLELSRITRRAITARMRYQRLRSRELDLMNTILGDEQDLAQTHLKAVDVQIGSIRNTLQDAGVGVIGKNGCRFDPGDNGPWCESSSDDSDSDKPRPAPLVLQAGSHCDSCAVNQVFIVSSSFFPDPTNAIDPSHLRVPDTLKAFSTKQAALIGDYSEIRGRSTSYRHIVITIIERHDEGFRLAGNIAPQLNFADRSRIGSVMISSRSSSKSKSKPTIMSFQAFSYDPNDPSSCTRRRSAARPPISGLSHRVFPYSRSTSSAHVTHGGSSTHSDSASIVSTSLTSAAGANSSMNPDRKRFKDFSSNEQVALTWAKRRMILNSATTTGWLRNITTAEKRAVNDYIVEIINQANLKFRCALETSPKVVDIIYKALLLNRRRLSRTSENLVDYFDVQPPSESGLSNLEHQAFKDRRQNSLFDSTSPLSYYLHGQEITDMSIFVLLFANPVVEEIHIAHWYVGKDSPLRDEDMRREIESTPTQMFSESAVSARLAIRRAVSGKTSLSGAPLHFATDPYADEQDAVNEAMLLALSSPTHGLAMEARMLNVHQRGIALRCSMGLEAPTSAISRLPTEEHSQIISEALQHARTTGLLLPQISQDLLTAGPHGPSTPDYSISVYIPLSLEELVFPRPESDIAPPSTEDQSVSRPAQQQSVANTMSHIRTLSFFSFRKQLQHSSDTNRDHRDQQQSNRRPSTGVQDRDFAPQNNQQRAQTMGPIRSSPEKQDDQESNPALAARRDSTSVPPLHTEICSIVQPTVTHARKVYFSGPLVKCVQRQSDGQRLKDDGWVDVWAQLSGTPLSIWDMKEIKEANKKGLEVPPTYVNITGSVTGPAESPDQPRKTYYTDALTLNTAGSNLPLFSCPSIPALESWATALRLSAWEKSRLEEMYTAHLIRITLLEALVRGCMEGQDWKRMWMVISGSQTLSTDPGAPSTTTTTGTAPTPKKRMSNLFSRDHSP
ncbi:hypothetical protein CY34DRAFT_7719 [Suillus luteus UH-Slu-Lm8-n1]|uniref:PH domain-containing protein n=1 Tax=Suillus luteus UH-Slu-Lm8-n1 TaxID=930992 RepID=A0A0D0C2C7_9AGAM|nr:hypothetical protein CY34DRAFT_7719 [Suillus luteus UH-Slu-Lm8-n1]